jgi:hypothetical protein
MLHRQALKECVYAEMLCDVVVEVMVFEMRRNQRNDHAPPPSAEGVRVCRDAVQCGGGGHIM